MEQIVLMICFLFYFILNPKFKKVTHFSHSAIKEPFSEVSLQTRESLKRPYFPLPLSILAGTNLIFFFFFWNPRLIPKKIHPPFDFQGKFILIWFPRKSLQNPQRKKKLFFFSIPVFYGSVHMGLLKHNFPKEIYSLFVSKCAPLKT